MHRTYSSLGVYYIDILVWCYVSSYLTIYVGVLWFRLVCCCVVFGVLHLQRVGVCFHSKLHVISMLAVVLDFCII